VLLHENRRKDRQHKDAGAVCNSVAKYSKFKENNKKNDTANFGLVKTFSTNTIWKYKKKKKSITLQEGAVRKMRCKLLWKVRYDRGEAKNSAIRRCAKTWKSLVA
jgi:hypothetical protein